MAAKSKSGLSETPIKVSPAGPRVPTKLRIRGVTKPETSSPSPSKGTRDSVDRSPRLSLDSKTERSSPSPLRAARHSALRVSLTSRMSIDQTSPKAETDSPSPLSTRHSDDRSPKPSFNSKPKIEWRSPKSATPSEKPQIRVSKGSELQAQLNSAQEDLKKAKEQISTIENEKAQAIDELKEAQKAAEEANEKLREALVAQKRAEESAEIEKFRAIELEQAGIEAAQKIDEELRKEIESAKNQHALDAASLRSTTRELERAKQELATACDAKNQALNRADDATKTAAIHAEKVEMLSAELVRLESLIDWEANENKEVVSKCKDEIESLKQKLEKAKTYEEKLIEKEAFIEQLNVDLEAARMAETYANKVVEDWKSRVEELEMQIEEAKKLERSATESLDSVTKQLESTNKSLLEAESENAALEEKVGLMEMTISKQIMDLVESEHCVHMAKLETTEMTKSVESLKSELEIVKEEKTRALDNEKLAASNVQTLYEEKTELLDELEKSRDEIEKSKKAMESLASAIYQVSTEAREAKEKLLSSEKEHENYETKLEDLRWFLKTNNEKYETMLGDAKNEIVLLTSIIQQSKVEWERKEHDLVDRVKKSEEEISRLANLLKQYEEEASASKEEEAKLKESLKEVESEVVYMQEAFKEAETESMKLKASLWEKETELQSVVQENDELRAREGASLKQAEELSNLLEEANTKLELPSEQPEQPQRGDSKDEVLLQADGTKVENANGQQVKEVVETKQNKDDSEKAELKMWEPELKSFVQEVESKVEVNEGLTEQINGSAKDVDDDGNSSHKQQQKKKKTLLRKFGGLLKNKKKGSKTEK